MDASQARQNDFMSSGSPNETQMYLSLANCYFAHDSSGISVLLRFCDA
jgi:hypothetical protein